MAVQNVANNPIGNYPVLVDRATPVNGVAPEMQVIRLDIGEGANESRVSAANPLPVSATFSGTIETTGQIADGVDENIKATVFDYTNSNPLAVRLTDTNGDYASISTAGLATEATLSTLNGKVTACNTGAVVVSSSALPSGAASAANQATEIGHLADIANFTAITSPIGDVVDTAGSTIGSFGAMVLGSDGTNARFLKTDAAGELQVDVLSTALPTGAATEAKQDDEIAHLASIDGATSSIETNFGNVVRTDGSGASTSLIQVGGTDGLNAQIVRLDSDGHPQVDVLTMPTVTVQATNLDIRDLTSASDSVAAVQSGSWSVTANAGTNLNTSALALETGGNLAASAASLAILDNAISGNEMQVDIVGALPAGTNGIGKLTANSGVDIGDVDVTSVVPGTGASNLGKAEDGSHTTGDVGVGSMGVRADTPASSAADNDYEFIKLNSLGAQWVAEVDRSLYAIQVGTTGDQTTIAAPGAGNSTYLDFIYVKGGTTSNPGVILVKFGSTTVFPFLIPAATATGTGPNISQFYVPFPKGLRVGDNVAVVVNNNDAGHQVVLGYSTRKTY